MSSDLFHVEILKNTATTVLVEVTDTHHEISAPETEAFFFAALHEPAQDTEHPLGQACGVDQMSDEKFVLKNTRAYLAGVELMEGPSAVKATYLVRFTDAKWCAHLRRGLAWGTTSYDLGKPVFGRELEARREAEKQRAKAEPPPPPVAAPAEKRTCDVIVSSLSFSSKQIEIKIVAHPSGIVPPVTAGFFFLALREELLRGGDAAIQAILRKLCPDDAVADDALVAAAASKVLVDLELYGWYGVGQSTFLYRLTFPQKKWGEALKSGQTWTTEARDVGPAVLARALAKMTGVKVAVAEGAKGAKKAAGKTVKKTATKPVKKTATQPAKKAAKKAAKKKR